ncbi:FHA domain protein [Dictyocaulus viviparus]|uniref:FHA domain protein n=1 Tax=Dictyocaulus viviparus TaxID=29172 RepID=A0A0D8XPI1_DICVI|nr:FHA domain protein [Dictyocaulus viviparus]
MTESLNLTSFKTPIVPHHRESSESSHHMTMPSNPETVEKIAKTFMPDDCPHSPIERAAAEAKISITHPDLHYTAPSWAAIPDPGQGYKLEKKQSYAFKVVKNGVVVDTIDLDVRKHNTFVVIGRLPNCDVVLDHPSISRYHCILQYGEDLIDKTGKGWHIYDMGSTHGSKANKKKLPPKQYIRIRVGFVLQFGGSTRLLSLLGPSSDCEAEWNCSPSEMLERVRKKTLEAKLATLAQKEIELEKANEAGESSGRDDDGIDWGMNYGEDYVPCAEVEVDAHLMDDREQYYQADPKKALAKFFEREGFDMQFQMSEQGSGHTHKWLCTIELPIEINGVDRAYTAQAVVSTSKKDAQIQCALEACRILDAHGVLRSSNLKARSRRNNLEANDFYDDDDDVYLDRTGQIEAQREKRMKWAMGNKRSEKAEKKATYNSLCKELEETRSNIAELKKKLDELHVVKLPTNSGDSVDDYCRQLNQNHVVAVDMNNKVEISLLRQKLVALTHDAQRLEKLVKIAKPTALPEIKIAGVSSGGDKQAFLRKMMMVGRKQPNDGTPNSMSGIDVKAVDGASSTSESFQPEIEEDETTSEVVNMAKPTYDVTDSLSNNMLSAVVEGKILTEPVHTKFPPAEHFIQPGISRPEDSIHEGCNRSNRKLGNCESSFVEKTETEDNDAPKKKRRARVRTNRHLPSSSDVYGTGIDDERYATWLPPDDQTGDGKTALNKKFEGRY